MNISKSENAAKCSDFYVLDISIWFKKYFGWFIVSNVVILIPNTSNFK
jgi:hypothetical protein